MSESSFNEKGGLFTRDVGEGPAVVLVHGTPSSSFEFRHVIAALEGELRCVAVDHLGFGQSEKPANVDYSLIAHQRRFSAAMDALDLRDAVFVLHDFGTAIAFPWLVANPERVRGLVLANTFLWPATGLMRWMLAFYSTAVGRWLYRAANLSVGMLLPWAWGTHTPLTAELHAQYKQPFSNRNERYATSALPGELIGQTLTGLAGRAAELGNWPVRAVWGMADPMVGPSELQKWRALLPDLAVEEVPKAGHFVADEAPDAIVRAVLALQ